MASVARRVSPPQPTNAAPLVRLVAYTQTVGLEQWLARRKRGVATLVLSLLWLVLAWRGSGRPYHLTLLQEPLVAALLGVTRLPTAETLRRSLAYFPAQAVRRAVEAAYLAELPRRPGRVWGALDAHQVPYWGRGEVARLPKGWSGSQTRCVHGLQLLALAARSPTDRRGPWVYVTSLQGLGPGRLIALYRQRWRVEQAIAELIHGHALNHLVSTRLHPNRIALGFRLLARNLAIGLQIRDAAARPTLIPEPLAFRATQVDGLGLFRQARHTIYLVPLHPLPPHPLPFPWTRRVVRLVA